MAAKRIGFIGLGAMGMGMAKRLLGAGHAVTGFDLREEALDRLAAAGGTKAQTPAEAAGGAELVFLMVVNAAQVEDVLYGAGNVAAALERGTTVVCSATVPPAFARALGRRMADAGLHLLDAPVSGGSVGAEGGTLTIMASGAPEAFAAADEPLAACARTVFRLGDAPGAGSAVKIVNQLMAGVNLVVAAEGMAFGVASGADPKTLLEIVGQSAGGSWMLNNRGPHMIEGDYTPLSAMTIWQKDLGIVLDTARELGMPTPMTSAAYQIVLRGIAAGLGGLDDAAYVKLYEQDAGISVSAPEAQKS
ncbi:L-threonate dehydrogenase [Marinivivus vitaminiproducens]|uniref:L-threonate dehydrogenase n=1 Tax=Marinivivus vitaminiproducens TaxID=3035935 RepID=UPI0027A05CD9|nr:NAD(P)-binding domain-containing protein [Geminicoccaceae bacterium SCSIO 64248]